MDVAELRVKRWRWRVTEWPDGRLFCKRGAIEFHAKDADEADAEIGRREPPMTVEDLGAELGRTGF